MTGLEAEIVKKLPEFVLRAEFACGGDGTLAILGPSGCGKTTLLRCLAGVAKPDEGRIVLNGRVLYDSAAGICLPPGERRIGLLFQNRALFPRMTVRRNVLCCVRRDGGGGAALPPERVFAALRLGAILDRPAAELSGGEAQRVALARILVNGAAALLLDEPLASLDEYLRFAVEMELREAVRNFPGPAVFVTHDWEQARRLDGPAAIMDRGELGKPAPKDEIAARPGTVAAARITGVRNIAPARAAGGRLLIPGWGLDLPLADAAPGPAAADVGAAGIREEAILPPGAARGSGPATAARFRVADAFGSGDGRAAAGLSPAAAEPVPLYWRVPGNAPEPRIGDEIELHIRRGGVMPLRF